MESGPFGTASGSFQEMSAADDPTDGNLQTSEPIRLVIYVATWQRDV